MSELKKTTDAAILSPALITDLSRPIGVEQEGRPRAVLIDYDQYQALQARQAVLADDSA